MLWVLVLLFDADVAVMMRESGCNTSLGNVVRSRQRAMKALMMIGHDVKMQTGLLTVEVVDKMAVLGLLGMMLVIRNYSMVLLLMMRKVVQDVTMVPYFGPYSGPQ
jgi:hypothetical protein